MKIKYYSAFSKKRNSTKIPTGGTEVDVYLKESTSILNPVFITKTIPDTANYIYCGDFGRYYFVTDIVHVTAMNIEIHCAVDVLATYKSQIGSYSGFKEYAATSGDVTIGDSRNVPGWQIDTAYNTIAFGSTHFDTGGCYVIGVLNDKASGASGVVTYYAVKDTEMSLFAADIYSQTFIQRIVDQFNAVQDSLVSCIWLPIAYNTIPGSTEKIYIGREQTVADGKKLSNRILTNSSGSTNITFPSGSGAGNQLEYIDLPPYTSGGLYLPFVGIVPINIEPLAFTKNIDIEYTIDLLTGDIVYQVRFGGLWMSTYNGNIATKLPVTGASYDGVGVATGALAVIGGAVGTALTIASDGGAAPVLGGVASMLGGAMSAAKSMELHTMINGNASSAIGAYLGLVPFYYIIQRIPSMTNLTAIQAEQGLPVFDVETTGAGYNKYNNAAVDIPGYESEKNEVNSFLNSGFYYE